MAPAVHDRTAERSLPPETLFAVARLRQAWRSAAPPLLFGLRLWLSVCLALFVAFKLELDDPFWAGTSAALVCQPQLGASMRKGWFRMVGTVIGAAASVALTACFPQDRILFLASLAVWGGLCAFCATLLRNYAAYAAALAGYTVIIIASDQLGASGGLNGQAFMLAVTRATEIAIGIAASGLVLAGTDFGGAPRRLGALLAGLTTEIAAYVVRALSQGGAALPDTQPVRRGFIRRVVALDPVIDETIGESSQIRYHTAVLQTAVDGLIDALSGWRAIANHLVRLPDDRARQETALVMGCIPPALLSRLEQADPAEAAHDPTRLRLLCESAVHGLISMPAATASLRLLADKAAEALLGVADALNGLALLVADPARPVARQGGFRLRVADGLPALLNALRAFVTIGAAALFWVVTSWPSGAVALIWAGTVVILFTPQSDQAYATAIGYTVGAIIAAIFAATMAFAILPRLETFAAFAIVLGLYIVPVGALAALPARKAVFASMAAWFVPLLAPANPMDYDTLQFYNTVLAFVAGPPPERFPFV